MSANEWEVPPPASMTVEHERRPVLHLPDGRVLVRQAGFTMNGERAVQTTGTNPPLSDNTKRKPKKR